jgi:hypothetical protein
MLVIMASVIRLPWRLGLSQVNLKEKNYIYSRGCAMWLRTVEAVTFKEGELS